MPRKSIAALSVVPLDAARERAQLKAPADLTAAERRIWRSVVEALPGGTFDRIDAVALAGYCRAEALAQALSVHARDADPATAGGRGTIATAALQARTSLALARSLRLTRQARADRDAVATAARRGRAGPATLDQLKARYGTQDDD